MKRYLFFTIHEDYLLFCVLQPLNTNSLSQRRGYMYYCFASVLFPNHFELIFWITLLGRDSFLFLLGERREETSAHKPCSQPLLTTSRLAFPIVYAEIISACHICRALACKAFPPKQSFSSFRLNYAELADFRLYQTLFVRETMQKFLHCLRSTEIP